MNVFQPLYDACNTGTNAAKYAALAGFPSLIDIEPSGLCNQRCSMCPTGLMSLGRPQNFMAEATFDKIVWECMEHGTAIRMIGWGEPTLNPNIVEFVSRAYVSGLDTHINTNGTKIDAYMAAALIDAGLSSLKFSFQGVDRESYREMRRSDFFDDLMVAIRTTHEVRGGRALPFLQASTSTTYETDEQIEAFRALVSPYVDQVTVGKTIFDYVDRDKVPERHRARFAAAAAKATDAKRHPSPCPEVWEKVSIHWDGSVVTCCNDFGDLNVLGNVNETSIASMWRHPKMEKYRQRLAADDYSLPLCRTCFSYMEGTA